MPPQLLPALDVVPAQGMSPHAEILAERAIALWRMAPAAGPDHRDVDGRALLRIEPAEFYRQLWR